MHLTPKIFFPEIIRFILWSNVAQRIFESVKSSNFYALSKYVKMLPFWLATEFNGAWVEGRMWRKFENTMIVRICTCFCGEGCECSSKNCQPGALQGGCSNSTNLQEVLRFMSYRFYVGMIVLKRRNEERDGSISWKRNVQSEREREREPPRSSSICSMLFKPNDFVQRLDF